MGIDDRIEQIRLLLEKVRSYNHIVAGNNFEQDTIDDMKGNAKDICSQAKAEIDAIKADIDQWE